MPGLDRLLGLYLSITYVVVVVTCFHLWRRGRNLGSVALFVVPIGVWAAWESLNRSPAFDRFQLGIGFLPLLPAIPLLCFVWLISIAPKPSAPGVWATRGSRLLVALVNASRKSVMLWLVSLAGAGWFGFGYLRFRDVCSSPTGAESGMMLGNQLMCASSAAGLWPLLVTLSLLVAGSIGDRRTSAS